MDIAVDDLNGDLETYCGKWMTVKTENVENLRRTNQTLLLERKNEVTTSKP